MSDIKVYTDPKYAASRDFVQENFDRVMSGKIKIQSGPGAGEYYGKSNGKRRPPGDDMPPPTSLCIMECAAYVLGWEKIDDSPPCTSEFIMGAMIAANDGMDNDRKRGSLRALLPIIVNTAPYHYVTLPANRTRTVSIEVAETLDSDPLYQEIEQKRKERFSEWMYGLPPRFHKNDPKEYMEGEVLDFESVEWITVTAPMFIEIITELASMGHFGKHNGEQDEEMFKRETTRVIESGETMAIQEEQGPLAKDFPDSLPNTPPAGQPSHTVDPPQPHDGEVDMPEGQISSFDQSDTADAQEDQAREDNDDN